MHDKTSCHSSPTTRRARTAGECEPRSGGLLIIEFGEDMRRITEGAKVAQSLKLAKDGTVKWM